MKKQEKLVVDDTLEPGHGRMTRRNLDDRAELVSMLQSFVEHLDGGGLTDGELAGLIDEVKALDGDDGSMTLQTFRAGARWVEWPDAARECEEAAQTYEEGPTPEALWIYPGGVWLAELADEEFELHLERSRMKSLDRDQLDRELHEWAVRECNLYEPDPPEVTS